MTSFAIIAEGPTDLPVIKGVILALLKEGDREPAFAAIQPDLERARATGAPPHDGWGLVLGALRDGKHRQALARNDFLVIHVDTDVCEEQGFDVPRGVAGGTRAPRELAEAVRDRLIAEMGESYVPLADRIFFAIAVDTVECWFLPALAAGDARVRGRTTNCLHKVDELLLAQGERPLGKDPRRYQELSRRLFRRKRDILAVKDHNPSLGRFVDELLAREVHLDEDA